MQNVRSPLDKGVLLKDLKSCLISTDTKLEIVLASYAQYKMMHPLSAEIEQQVKKERTEFAASGCQLYEYLWSILSERYTNDLTPLLINHPQTQDLISKVDDYERQLSPINEISNLNTGLKAIMAQYHKMFPVKK
jgi:hypothetical protein